MVRQLLMETGAAFQPQWTAPALEQFEQMFATIQTKFARGELTKVVPVVFETAESIPDQNQIWFSFMALLKAPALLSPYGFWTEGRGLLGATPELLLRQESETEFLTSAVAGTRSAETKVSLLESPKDMTEHQIVVEDILQRLKMFGAVKKSKVREVAFGSIFHLKTDISLESKKPVPFFEVLQRLHPTAALGTFPREPGLQWLSEQPGGLERGRFGGPFGYLDDRGWGSAWVAIRSLEWNANQSRIGSGCGIVAASQCPAEWQELQIKRESVKRNLGLL
jgi:menaquinone-specific isochorismate synthase